MRTPTIRFVIPDVYMGRSHAGLNEIIKEHKRINPLFRRVMKEEGGLVLFVNNTRTAAKLYAENGSVLGYLRMPRNQPITQTNLDAIPATFGGSMAYASAAKNALKKLLEMDADRGRATA